jgi:hypothetical protein
MKSESRLWRQLKSDPIAPGQESHLSQRPGANERQDRDPLCLPKRDAPEKLRRQLDVGQPAVAARVAPGQPPQSVHRQPQRTAAHR